MKILVTGVAGFIGMHIALKLLARGDNVVGIDNLNDYYDINLKKDRLSRLTTHSKFSFYQIDISDRGRMSEIFMREKSKRIIHLAAQAGVRYSLSNPYAYIDSNIQGFINILEGCRQHQVEHLVYASSSSVYGGNTSLPFNRPLKNVFEAADARQKQAKKRSLCLINEHFESVFNTAAATQIVFQRPVRDVHII